MGVFLPKIIIFFFFSKFFQNLIKQIKIDVWCEFQLIQTIFCHNLGHFEYDPFFQFFFKFSKKNTKISIESRTCLCHLKYFVQLVSICFMKVLHHINIDFVFLISMIGPIIEKTVIQIISNPTLLSIIFGLHKFIRVQGYYQRGLSRPCYLITQTNSNLVTKYIKNEFRQSRQISFHSW